MLFTTTFFSFFRLSRSLFNFSSSATRSNIDLEESLSNLEKKVRITGASIASLHQVSKQAKLPEVLQTLLESYRAELEKLKKARYDLKMEKKVVVNKINMIVNMEGVWEDVLYCWCLLSLLLHALHIQ